MGNVAFSGYEPHFMSLSPLRNVHTVVDEKRILFFFNILFPPGF